MLTTSGIFIVSLAILCIILNVHIGIINFRKRQGYQLLGGFNFSLALLVTATLVDVFSKNM